MENIIFLAFTAGVAAASQIQIYSYVCVALKRKAHTINARDSSVPIAR